MLVPPIAPHAAPFSRPPYLDLCIPPFPPDLNCSVVYNLGFSHTTVIGVAQHGFDGNDDGVGCKE